MKLSYVLLLAALILVVSADFQITTYFADYELCDGPAYYMYGEVVGSCEAESCYNYYWECGYSVQCMGDSDVRDYLMAAFPDGYNVAQSFYLTTTCDPDYLDGFVAYPNHITKAVDYRNDGGDNYWMESWWAYEGLYEIGYSDCYDAHCYDYYDYTPTSWYSDNVQGNCYYSGSGDYSYILEEVMHPPNFVMKLYYYDTDCYGVPPTYDPFAIYGYWAENCEDELAYMEVNEEYCYNYPHENYEYVCSYVSEDFDIDYDLPPLFEALDEYMFGYTLNAEIVQEYEGHHLTVNAATAPSCPPGYSGDALYDVCAPYSSGYDSQKFNCLYVPCDFGGIEP